MIYMSKEARRVAAKVEALGLDLSADDVFKIELCCSLFHVNHIVGIIDQVMKGGNAGTKLLKAQEQGWQYFHKPVVSMLTGRKPAHRRESIPASIGFANGLGYRVVAKTLLLADMNREEADFLLYDLMGMVPDLDTVSRAIAACKERGNRTVFYLRGILQREHQTREGKKREILQAREGAAPFEIPSEFRKLSDKQAAELRQKFEDALRDGDMIKSLNDYARKHAKN